MEKQTNAPSRGSLRPHLLLMLEAKRSRSDRTTDRRSAVMKKWLSATEIQMKWRWCCRLSWCRSSHQPHVRRNTLPPLPVIIWKSIHLQQEIICVETLTLQETKGHLMTPSQGPGEAGLQRAPSDWQKHPLFEVSGEAFYGMFFPCLIGNLLHFR